MNRLLPTWQFGERHELRLTDVTPAQAYAGIVPGLATDDRLIAQAIALREMPGRLLKKLGFGASHLPSRPFGFHSFTRLGEAPGQEIAFGLAGRFWHMDYGLHPVADVAAFARLTELPRLVLNVCVEAVDGPGCRLVTHTRVHCPTTEQRRRFAPYWYAIRPVSGLIRRRLLQRIAHQARTLPP